jgi:hypothetical protein
MVSLAIVSVTACSADRPAGPTDESVGPLFARGGSQAQPVDQIENFGLVPGAAINGATLGRNANNVSAQIQATVPGPNTATVWAAVFDAPENCLTTPCGLPDLGNAAAMPTLLRAGGRVIGGGPVNIAGHVKEGDTSEALLGAGMMDAMTAEVHFILRLHGPQIPMMVNDQIHSFGGGCAINPCADVGAAIFQPPN